MHFSEPQSNLLQLGLREGMRVGDFGVGSGHYALSAAGIVGPTGHIYAIDIQEDLLKHVEDAAAKRGLKNIETIWGDIEKPGGSTLRNAVLDAVVFSNTFFQVEHRENTIAEIRRVMKSGGKLLVVDWAGSYNGLGPSKEQIVSEHVAEELFITGGFHKVKSFRAGPHHYALVFTSP